MRVIRQFVNQVLSVRQEIKLGDSARHHAVNVLRLNKRSTLTLFNGDGHDYVCKILKINKNEIVVEITHCKKLENESALETNLYLGLSKSTHMDYAIQKTVEMGVSNIQPVITERSILSINQNSLNNKHRHWEKIIIHACEQCGRARLPKLRQTVNYEELNDLDGSQPGFIFDERPEHKISEYKNYHYSHVSLFVGPEGGFTETEIEIAKNIGFQPVAFGPRVLRTETAAQTAVATAQLFWGDLASNEN